MLDDKDLIDEQTLAVLAKLIQQEIDNNIILRLNNIVRKQELVKAGIIVKEITDD